MYILYDCHINCTIQNYIWLMILLTSSLHTLWRTIIETGFDFVHLVESVSILGGPSQVWDFAHRSLRARETLQAHASLCVKSGLRPCGLQFGTLPTGACAVLCVRPPPEPWKLEWEALPRTIAKGCGLECDILPILGFCGLGCEILHTGLAYSTLQTRVCDLTQDLQAQVWDILYDHARWSLRPCIQRTLQGQVWYFFLVGLPCRVGWDISGP